VSIGEILADLRVASNFVSQVEGFFNAFYVSGGVDAILGYDITYSIQGESMSTNITVGEYSSDNTIVLPVSDNVEAIIQWITVNFQSELQSILS